MPLKTQATSSGDEQRICKVLDVGESKRSNLSPYWAHQAKWLSKRVRRGRPKAGDFSPSERS